MMCFRRLRNGCKKVKKVTLSWRILEDSLTLQLYADLALISSLCYAPANNSLSQRGQTNPRRGQAGACGTLVLLQLIPCLCFRSVFEKVSSRIGLFGGSNKEVWALFRIRSTMSLNVKKSGKSLQTDT